MAENKENSKEVQDLLAKIEALETAAKAKEEQNKALLESNGELQVALEESQKTVEAVVTLVTDGKHKYKLLAKQVQIQGKKYSAEELVEDKELVKHLVKIGSGVLQKI